MCNLSAGRISQYISEGKLGAAELEGVGRAAKIRVPQALAALKLRLDAGQMFGNGLDTNLRSAAPQKPDAPSSPHDDLDLRIKKSKLEEQESRNRKIAEEERLRLGVYMLTEDARSEMAKLTGQILQAVEGGLADMASAIAAEHKLPQRDLVHMMRNQFREVRAKLAQRMTFEAGEVPAVTEIADTQH